MRRIKEELAKRDMELDKMTRKLNAELLNSPKGKLRAVYSKGRQQYFIRGCPSDRSGRYVKKSDIPQAAAIAQRDYNILARKTALAEKAAIEALLQIYDSGTVEDVYDSLSPQRRALVHPSVVTDEEFAKLWLDKSYQGKGFAEGVPEYYSTKGIRVRSKSEALIADMYDDFGIPMKYECPITLWNGKTVYPDFTLLDIRERKIIIHEHLGMADDPEYMRKAVRRLRDLQLSGFTLGVNLIITIETKDMPLDMRMVREQIRQMGLCPLST